MGLRPLGRAGVQVDRQFVQLGRFHSHLGAVMSAELLASVAASLGLKPIEPDAVACGLVDGFPTQLALTEGKSMRVLFRHAGEDNDIEVRAAIAQSPEVKASGQKLALVAVASGTVTLLITDGFVRVPSQEVILLRMRAVLQASSARSARARSGPSSMPA
jgi:hypothetical protein